MSELQVAANGVVVEQTAVQVPEQVILATINYLATRPYLEVHYLVDALRPLINAEPREEDIS